MVAPRAARRLVLTPAIACGQVCGIALSLAVGISLTSASLAPVGRSRSQIERVQETIELHGAKINAEKARFVGDFNATVWFDDKKNFVKAETDMKGRKVKLVVDP